MPIKTDVQLRQIASELSSLLSREVIRDFRPIIVPDKFLDGTGKPVESRPDFSLEQIDFINTKISSRLSSVYAAMRNIMKEVEDNLTKLNSDYYQATINDLANPYIERSFKLPDNESELDRKVYTFPYGQRKKLLY